MKKQTKKQSKKTKKKQHRDETAPRQRLAVTQTQEEKLAVNNHTKTNDGTLRRKRFAVDKKTNNNTCFVGIDSP